MPDHGTPSSRYGLSALIRPRALASFVVIGAIVAAVAASFAYVAGVLSPHRLTQARMIDRFELVNGPHPGFRRNHAKGVCVAGWFDSNGAGQRLSKAAVFRPGRTPVVGRFALAGGMPAMADNPKAVRSMALSFRPAGGGEWRTGMNDIPVFPVATPRAFYDQLLAARPDPATGKPDPARMKAFLARYPQTGQALRLIGAQPFSSGFDNASYNSLDAFRFVDAQGRSTPVRWSMAAVQPFAPEPAGEAGGGDPNYLFDALVARLRQGPLSWRLVVTVGQPGDPTNDATRPWPANREHVEVGTLTLNQVEAESPGDCRDINFDPLVLPPGIAASDDPLLSARSAAYSTSFTRRAGEAKSPSAVQVPAGGKGA
ncbi:MAG: catalase family peroxidase [Caulobacteraceae bacterium]|nr:catalase family peroxidase [Caulobacteraceae bacterium]